MNTENFTVPVGSWRLSWTNETATFLSASAYTPATREFLDVIIASVPPGSGVATSKVTGTIYLSISANGRWRIALEQAQ